MGGRGETYCRQEAFQVCSKSGEPAETTFMIPETVDYNGNVKTVKLGETYKYCEETGGGSDHFWGFAPLDCGHCKVIVNKSDKTVSFRQTYVGNMPNRC